MEIEILISDCAKFKFETTRLYLFLALVSSQISHSVCLPIRMTITMKSRRLGWPPPPGDQITLSSLSSHTEHSVEFTYSCFITSSDKHKQNQKYWVLWFVVKIQISLPKGRSIVLKVYLSMLRTTSMLEEAMNPPVLAIISTLQTKFPAYH